MNPHELLGVSRSASQSEIKKAFREAAKELHPDLSNSPEAAEAFKRIKDAHDALISQAETPRESVTAAASAARATAATTHAAFSQSATTQQITDEELKHIQELDELARQKTKASFLHRSKEPEEVKRHRKKLKTNERRLRGLY